MGIDGFSMGNLGLNSDLTSAQMASQSEHLAKKETEFVIKDVTGLSKDGIVKRKKENSENQKQFDDGFKKKQEDAENDENAEQDELSLLSETDFEGKDPREFSVRINPNTEMVELFNNKDKRIVETINAQDLMALVSKLNSASGILVNRKI